MSPISAYVTPQVSRDYVNTAWSDINVHFTYYLAFISQKQLSVTNISITSCCSGNGLGPTRAQAITQTQDVPHFQTHVKTNYIPYSVLNKPLNGTNKQRLIANRNEQLNSFKQTINSLTVLCDLGDHKPAHNTSSIRTSIASNVMGSLFNTGRVSWFLTENTLSQLEPTFKYQYPFDINRCHVTSIPASSGVTWPALISIIHQSPYAAKTTPNAISDEIHHDIIRSRYLAITLPI